MIPLHKTPGIHHLRFKRIPAGYQRHAGKKMPVQPDDYVHVVVKTSEGLGFSGPMRAMMHDWNPDNHPKGLGAVVAYRVIGPGE